MVSFLKALALTVLQSYLDKGIRFSNSNELKAVVDTIKAASQPTPPPVPPAATGVKK